MVVRGYITLSTKENYITYFYLLHMGFHSSNLAAQVHKSQQAINWAAHSNIFTFE